MKMTTIERFESKFVPEPNSGCWLWSAMADRDGYGRFHADGKMVGAHRFSFEVYVGPIPGDLHVLHRCDEPSCVNPAHLFLGTNADNVADRDAKGRQAIGDRNASRLYPERRPRGEGHANAKLTSAQAAAIHAAQGETGKSVAARLGVSETLVSRVRRGKAWTHIPQPQPPEAAP